MCFLNRLPRWGLVLAALLWVMTGPASAGATPLRVLTYNVKDGLGAPGSVAFEAVLETLRRLNPDVIAFQEIDAQHTTPSNAAHFSHLKNLLGQLGFPTTRAYLAAAGDAFSTQTYSAGDFGPSTQSLAIASRHPIIKTTQIGRGVSGRREQTRFPLFVKIDVPETDRDPAFVNVHFKQGGTMADEFRRGLEALRVRQFLENEGLSGAAAHVFVLGDMNEQLGDPQTASFSTAGLAGGHRFADGSTLPATFQLGGAVPGSLAYAGFPGSGFGALGLAVLPATQTDGVSDRTYNFAGDARLDYILAGPFTRDAGAARTEVYHSGKEPVGDGLPKSPTLPLPEMSVLATDHLPVFADVLLEPAPALSLTLPAAAQPVDFTPPATPLQGTVSIPAPATEPLAVTIAPFREAPLQPIAPVVIPAGQTSAAFPISTAGTPFMPDRRITLVASAAGHREGLGVVAVRGSGAAGRVLISQYTETPSGSAPKAIEIMNASAREVFFAAEPLHVLLHRDGAATGQNDALITTGRLPRGAVVVIGDAATGQHLTGQGLLSATAAEVDNAPAGTVFTDTGEPDGRAIFVKDAFTFNGNDALAVRLNGQLCDVFGQPGNNPGTAWSSSNPAVSTQNQNLSRKRSALAPSAGWTNPSLFFETAGSTLAAALTGFGVAPILDDPYAEWAAARGLAGAAAAPEADPDGNGVPNGLDFALGQGAPAVLSVERPDETTWIFSAQAMARQRLGNLRWGAAVSEDLRSWRPVAEMQATPGAADGSSPAVLTLPGAPLPQHHLRFYFVKP